MPCCCLISLSVKQCGPPLLLLLSKDHILSSLKRYFLPEAILLPEGTLKCARVLEFIVTDHESLSSMARFMSPRPMLSLALGDTGSCPRYTSNNVCVNNGDLTTPTCNQVILNSQLEGAPVAERGGGAGVRRGAHYQTAALYATVVLQPDFGETNVVISL